MTEQMTPQQEVDNWNATVNIGDMVEYREIMDAAPTRYQTRTEAQVLSGHTAVVWLTGKTGCVCVSHCIKVTEQSLTDLMDENRVVQVTAAELAELRRDAWRYRWLRDQKHIDIAAWWFLPVETSKVTPNAPTEIDAAIDAAMQANK
jgi:hypothetical protein